MSIPRFAVVGHPNKGKSSIVSTLAQDDSVYVDRISGSTKKSTTFPMSVNGKVLYELIDTPGFQRARSVLDWLNKHCDSTAKRPDAVRDFLNAHKNDDIYVNECELLQPIVEGAGIIYVVDGSRPYGSEYEAEMEILRWTGNPSLALINPIDNKDYVGEWENALGQYFKTVREFDAHRAEFVKCTALLKVFGQLLPQWEQALSEAVDVLLAERQRQHKQASELIASLLVESLQHKESQNIGLGISPEPIKKLLSENFEHHLRKIESRCRENIEETYDYQHIHRAEQNLDFTDSNSINFDLFDQESWYLFGLSKKQLVALSASAGAGAGVLIDIGLGGHSLFLGSVIGGLSGGIGAWTFSEKIASFTLKGLPTGGETLSYGPVSHPNFPFVVLGRALFHLQSICARTHANRDHLNLENNQALELLSTKQKTTLVRLFKDISKNKNTIENRQKISEILVELARSFDKN